jgi:hypothetical protein
MASETTIKIFVCNFEFVEKNPRGSLIMNKNRDRKSHTTIPLRFRINSDYLKEFFI